MQIKFNNSQMQSKIKYMYIKLHVSQSAMTYIWSGIKSRAYTK